jgi:hypothetical protein
MPALTGARCTFKCFVVQIVTVVEYVPADTFSAVKDSGLISWLVKGYFVHFGSPASVAGTASLPVPLHRPQSTEMSGLTMEQPAVILPSTQSGHG